MVLDRERKIDKRELRIGTTTKDGTNETKDRPKPAGKASRQGRSFMPFALSSICVCLRTLERKVDKDMI